MLNLNGYLGNEINESRKRIYEENKKLFDLCIEINQFCQIFKYELKVDDDDNIAIVSTLLYFKLLDSFQTVVLLYGYGLDTQARTVNRTILEGLWVLKNLNINPQETYQLLLEDEYFKKVNMLQDIKNNNDDFYKYISFNNILNVEEEMKKLEENMKRIGVKKIRKINAKEMALNSDSELEYYYIYKLLCVDVHVDTGQLTNYSINLNGIIEGFDDSPRVNSIEEILITTSDIILKATMVLSKIVKIDKTIDLKYYFEKVHIF
ncbi:MAG: hypothetical protein K0Q49_286 [Haloplasmataceae bacterium]|jgi:hypothetical protein|nr:hypothetical protein [Haloplasmataceae bacterium]